ncbi:MTH1187 family thiamine-binding protein [Paenibacillus sp. KN14-4R]|uniref:MTH1187 family thiamine-binding protein n=1 Tax=Paenibacillus sp. KN14-4R TaxID=3445773 RepID=UPI003FA029BD
MAIAEVTIIPIGTGTTSLSSYVADMQRTLSEQTGITYQLTPMSTIIEGPLERLLEVIGVLHEGCFVSGAARVSTSVKIDDRRDKAASCEQKMQSVNQKMQLKTDPISNI